MIAKNNYETSSVSDNFDSKSYHGKNTLNKYEHDLFDEENDVVEKTIRVKRVSMPNKCEKWKIIEDSKTVFIVDGDKISKKEKEYLRTIDGFNFLIEQYKSGIKSLNKLRIELKKNV